MLWVGVGGSGVEEGFCLERGCDDNVGGGAGIRLRGSATTRAKRITAALSEGEVKWRHGPHDKAATEWR